MLRTVIRLCSMLVAAIVLLPALFLQSCERAGEDGGITVQPDSTIVLGFNGGTFKVAVESLRLWNASSDSARVMIAPSRYKGSCRVSITVPPTENLFEKDLAVNFIIEEDTTKTATIYIRQASAPYLFFDKEIYDAPYEGGSIEVPLHANAPWHLTVGVLYKKYLSASEGEGEMVLTVTVPAATRTKTISYTFSLVDFPEIKANLKIKQTKP